MKKRTDGLLILLGIGLLVVAAVVLIAWIGNIHVSGRKTANYVHTIRTLIPEPQGAMLEERRDNTMAVLSLEGTDFVGILEMPRYASALPICGDWGAVSKYPCRFEGSVYDSTMRIGGTSQKGQYDFYREISVGDAVYFTDMEGNRFSYEVTDIRYEQHADPNALQQKDAALTLFIKNLYAFEYIVVFCNPVR